MKQLMTICGLMACLAICTLNAKEAHARCDVLPARAQAPVWSQDGRKIVLIKNHDKTVVVYIKNKDGSTLEDCYPLLKYDRSKLRCTVKTYKKNLAEYEMESNHRVTCEAKVGKDTKSRLSVDAQGRKDIEVWSFQSYAMLLAIFKQLSRRVKALEGRVTENERVADDAHGTATEAKDLAIRAKVRKSAKVSIEIEGFISPVTQGMVLKDYPAGGVGMNFKYWFLETAKNNQIRLGAMVGLRWHRMMLTIDGAPSDNDVPGDQYDLLFNLAFRWKPIKWLSIDLNGGFEWVFFHHQDHISDDDPVAGPNGNVSQCFGLNLGGGLNVHLGQFYFGPHIMGAIIFNGLYHPSFEGEARYGTVKHFYFQLIAGVRF
jgi:hypothetical protein